ncbi:hypothetical protein ABZ372_34690, partial [Streptomyces sp. NPDC005921]
DLHGWGELGTELTSLSRDGRWEAMGALIDDEGPPCRVWKPQPIGAAVTRSVSAGTTITFSRVARACRAKLDWPKNEDQTPAPRRVRVVLPSGRCPALFRGANRSQ